MDQAEKERLVKSHLNYCTDFRNIFFINTGPIRTSADISNIVIPKQTKTVTDTTDVMDTVRRLKLKIPEAWENLPLFANLWLLNRPLPRRTVKNNEYCQGRHYACLISTHLEQEFIQI